MPPVSTGGRHGYIGPNQFESWPSRGMKTSNASNASTTGSLSSSDNARASPVTPDRMLGISPRSYSSPSEKDARMHTRTNFTRAYVPPVVPVSPIRKGYRSSPSPGRKGYPSDRNSMNPFDDDDDAPHDEIRPGMVRSLRPRPDRYYTATDDAPFPRPEAYISETDESSFMETDSNIPLDQRSRELSQESYLAPAPVVSPVDMEARHAEDVKNSPTRSHGKEARYVEDVKISPIPSLGKEARHVDDVKISPIPSLSMEAPSSPVEEVTISPRSLSPRHDQTEDLADRPRRRRKDRRSTRKTKPGDMPDFDRRNKDEEEWSKAVGDEIEYYSSAGDQLQDPEEYQEFGDKGKAMATRPASILKRGAAAEGLDDDEDSLFDFEGRKKERGNVRKGYVKDSSRRGRRPRRRSQQPDDEESLDQDYGAVPKRSSSLHERTQQAWTFRNQRSYSVEKPAPILKKDGVQFENKDTVHHFDDDECTTRTSRSMNSLYTKSPESETEDLIKDIFFIGSGVASNPGRRKIKYQPAYKRELKYGQDESTLDDTTLGTTDDVTLNTLDDGTTEGKTMYTDNTPYTEASDDMSIQTSPRKSDAVAMGCSPLNSVKCKVKNKENKEEDPLLMVWGFLDALSAAIGLTPSTEEQEKNESNEKEAPAMKEASTKKDAPAKNHPPPMKNAPIKEQKPVKAEVSCKKERPRKPPKTREAPTMKASSSDEFPEVKDNQGSFSEGVMGYIFGDATGDNDKHKKSSAASATTSSTPLEEDPRLEELALHAVRSKHQLHNVVFDESVTIDIVKDIKFSLVRMALPLGILFHENDGGCWITKIFPDGNAAKTGGVEVGDQLAAINGISAVKLRVDQICTLIKEAPNPKDIELTFLRYTGELLPLPVSDQEQFEVSSIQPLPIKAPLEKIRSLRPKSKSEDVEPKRETSLKSKNKAQVPSQQATESKRGFKWFGRGKRN